MEGIRSKVLEPDPECKRVEAGGGWHRWEEGVGRQDEHGFKGLCSLMVGEKGVPVYGFYFVIKMTGVRSRVRAGGCCSFKERQKDTEWFILECRKPPDYRSGAALLQEGGGAGTASGLSWPLECAPH